MCSYKILQFFVLDQPCLRIRHKTASVSNIILDKHLIQFVALTKTDVGSKNTFEQETKTDILILNFVASITHRSCVRYAGGV